MIDFELSDKQKQFREFIHALARDVVRPLSLQADRDHRIPEEFLARVNDMRAAVMGPAVPKDYGAAPKAPEDDAKKKKRAVNLTAAIGAEEMCWGDAAVLTSLPGPGLGGPPVLSMGTQEQKKRFFSVFDQRGLHWGAYGLTEPGAGSDVASIRTSCVPSPRGWVLNGTKCFITFHSVIESPLSVSRVAPPTRIMTVTSAQMTSSQMPTHLSRGGLMSSLAMLVVPRSPP